MGLHFQNYVNSFVTFPTIYSVFLYFFRRKTEKTAKTQLFIFQVAKFNICTFFAKKLDILVKIVIFILDLNMITLCNFSLPIFHLRIHLIKSKKGGISLEKTDPICRVSL